MARASDERHGLTQIPSASLGTSGCPSCRPETETPHPAGSAHASAAASEAQRSRTFAALDLGTNNCRLLVAKPSRRGFTVVDAFSRIVRLGEGLAASGALSTEAMTRAHDALKVCRIKMERNRVHRHRMVATEACRRAANAPDFLDRVRRDLGLEIEILTHEAEARLAVSGCASLIEDAAEHALIFDIGGGSSELIWLDLAARPRTWRRSLADRLEAQSIISAWTSLPIGVVTLAERFGGALVTSDSYEAMAAYVQSLIAPFEQRHGYCQRIRGRRVHMLGTSGTVTTLAGVHLGLKRYDRSRVDGTWLTVEEVRRVSRALLGLSYSERVSQPCIGRERADLVLAGCAILEGLLRCWPIDRLRVADRGLREGILTTLMAEDRA